MESFDVFAGPVEEPEPRPVPMRISFIGHASLLIEAGDVSILSDPWWNGPCFGAQWWLHPKPFREALRRRRPDYIYISHGHHDHFHPATLKLLDRDAVVLVARDSDLGPAIEALGFPVRPVADDEECRLAPNVRCRIVRTHADDTLMTVTDDQETCLNANDALHACPIDVQDRLIQLLHRHHPVIDYVFCGYGVASHFPNCYVVPGKDRVASATYRQHHFNRSWARIINGLEPGFGFPFAADVIFLDEDLFWSNEPLHNAERPTEVLRHLYPTSPTIVVDPAPGFVVEKGAIQVDRRRQPLSATALTAEYADAIRRANRAAPVPPDTFALLLDLLRTNVERCRPYLVTFPGDYRALIRLKGSRAAIQVSKSGSAITVEEVDLGRVRREAWDVVYTTRASYLRGSLTSRYGHEVLFVGSGGIFEYPDTLRLGDNLHQELAAMMRPADQCPVPRPTGFPALVRATKGQLRTMLGRRVRDLYDLREWTVFTSGPIRAEAR